MTAITGTFEIHCTIDPASQTRLLVLIESLKSNPDYSWMIRPRMTQVSELYGAHPIQPMFACFMHGTEPHALDRLKRLGDLFRSKDINCLRLKLEASASNVGVPEQTTTDDYFEFHFDIPMCQTQIARDWNKLVKILIPFGCHLSHNMNKDQITPIATIRHYGSLDEIHKKYTEIETMLSRFGYRCIKLQREYSVYDDNVGLDQGWLFDQDPKVPITDLSDEMLFS